MNCFIEIRSESNGRPKLCHITRRGQLAAEERLIRRAAERADKSGYGFHVKLLSLAFVPTGEHPDWERYRASIEDGQTAGQRQR